MSSLKLLIASSSREEAITKWIHNHPGHSRHVDILFIDELLHKYTIQDSLDDTKAVVRWYDNDVRKYSNQTHCLLNRVTHLKEDWFNAFQHSDREYARREFEAYLGFAFNSFQKAQNIAVNGVCERIFSLPQQWQKVARRLDIQVPEYYWGSRDYNPFAGKSDMVYSNIFDYLNWASNATDETTATGFCFKKPRGKPLFLTAIGSKYKICNTIALSEKQLHTIEQYLAQIKKLFAYFMFECLLFVNGTEISFGCVNIDIIRSQKHPQFADFLEENLIREYYQCLN